jgi:hypothetical protein
MEKKKMKPALCRVFGLVNYKVQLFVKTEPKLLMLLKGMDREQSVLEILNEAMSTRRSLITQF